MSSELQRQTVSKWELGVTTPEMDKLIQLSDFFHISIDELVGRGTPEPASEEAETEAGADGPRNPLCSPTTGIMNTRAGAHSSGSRWYISI